MGSSKQSATKEEFWRSIMDEFRDSGQTIRAFCRRKEISEGGFFAWRKRLAESNARAVGGRSGAKQLVPVEVVGKDGVRTQHSGIFSERSTGTLEVVTPGGCTLRFDRSIEASHLSDLLQSILRVESGVDAC